MLGGSISLLASVVPRLRAALAPWGPGGSLDPVQTPAVAREGGPGAGEGVQEPSRGHGAEPQPPCFAPKVGPQGEARKGGKPRSSINQTDQSLGIWRKWHRI